MKPIAFGVLALTPTIHAMMAAFGRRFITGAIGNYQQPGFCQPSWCRNPIPEKYILGARAAMQDSQAVVHEMLGGGGSGTGTGAGTGTESTFNNWKAFFGTIRGCAKKALESYQGLWRAFIHVTQDIPVKGIDNYELPNPLAELYQTYYKKEWEEQTEEQRQKLKKEIQRKLRNELNKTEGKLNRCYEKWLLRDGHEYSDLQTHYPPMSTDFTDGLLIGGAPWNHVDATMRVPTTDWDHYEGITTDPIPANLDNDLAPAPNMVNSWMSSRRLASTPFQKLVEELELLDNDGTN